MPSDKAEDLAQGTLAKINLEMTGTIVKDTTEFIHDLNQIAAGLRAHHDKKLELTNNIVNRMFGQLTPLGLHYFFYHR